jgi:pimeloyl-ACP methyl ester carboxylesterase
MRKLLLCWAMAGSHLLYAQDSLDFMRSKVQHLFKPVTQAYPTRTFLELGDDLLPLPVSNDPKKNMDLGQFSMLHHSIRTSQPTDKKWPVLQSQLASFSGLSRNRVPMALMDATVSLLNETAITDGSLTYLNGQFLPQSSAFFSTRRVMELSTTRATAEGPDVEVYFPNELWFSDQQGMDVSVQVKLEGNWETIAKGSGLWIRNLSDGVHEISYRIVAGSDTSTGTTSFKVLLPSIQTGMVEWVIPPAMAHFGGRATVQFATGNSSGHVRNPVILVEGIDYYQVAPDLIESGNSDYLDLRDRFRSVITQLSISSTQDFIYLDFRHGADDITRNAEVLRELIGIVNQDKLLGGSSIPNIVIGHSMGGLVARYCLSKMAKEGFNSQTSKLITHDSPHDGAHLPLGLQYLFHGINGIAGRLSFVPYIGQAHDILLAPATVQMLRYRASSINNYTENTWLDQVYKPMVTFPSGGQPFEFIATSLGSECGIPDQPPGQTFFNFDLSFSQIVSIGNPLISLANRVTSWKLRVLAKGQVGTQPSKILSLTLRHDKKFFNGFIQIGATIVNLSANSPGGILNLDYTPGGYYNITNLGFQFLGGLTTPAGAIQLNTGLNGTFTFIPAKSGLDMPGSSNSDYLKGYNPWMNGVPNSRVGTFRAAEPLGIVKNFHHGFLTFYQVKLITHKILNLPFTDFCPLECEPEATIAGPLAICPGSDAPYYIQTTAGDNLQFQWSGSGGIVLGGQNTDGTASFSVDPGNASSSMNIHCTVYKNGCFVTSSLNVDGTTNLAPITVRCGSAPNVTTPGTALCQNSPLGRYFYIESIPIGSNYTISWTPLPDDNGLLPIIEPYMSQGAFRNAFVKTNGVSTLRFRVDIESDCGSRSKDFEIPYNSLIGGSACILCDQGEFARVEPPVVREGTEMEVLVIKPGEGLGTVEIRNLEGELLVSKTSGDESEKMDVSQLEAGSYVVRIQNPETGTWEEKPLEVKPNHFMTINPNPGSDLIQLGFEGALESNTWRVTVVDRFGNVRYDQTLPFQPDGVNVQSLQPDLYLFKVENGPQVYQTWFRKN